ncbi:DUF4350 domain-containing protein [Ornithinibacillus californiensis]|uniref:DUF4350 domain-containing protein n=1 Tax=Ornithinibacillus californiensis TaxID=161536 RepID=UPI00064DE894|nr:DUF4350 domain-containing protein [Ornithinibacillus californiensis]
MQKSIKKTWVWLFVLLIIFIALSFVLGSKELEEYPPYISTSPSPTGVKGFYTYLEEEIGAVKRLEEAPTSLEIENQQLLIMVEPDLFSEQATMNDYIAFMEAGNTVLLLKQNLEGMFGLSTEYGMPGEEGTTTIYDSLRKEYKVTMLSPMRIVPDAESQIVYEDDDGVIAIKQEFGKGQLIAVNSPDWITNEYILEQGNLDVIHSLMEEEAWKTIWFDEYLHQSTSSKSLIEIYPMWLLVTCLQLIFLTLLWLLYKGKRFGPIRTPREEYVRYSDERITALAEWYKKGKVYRESLAHQAEYLRLLLREKWGISYQTEWKDLMEPLSTKLSNIKDDELLLFLHEIETVTTKENLSKQEYLLWTKRIDRLQKEVEQG